jgi:hypothetical protein
MASDLVIFDEMKEMTLAEWLRVASHLRGRMMTPASQSRPAESQGGTSPCISPGQEG